MTIVLIHLELKTVLTIKWFITWYVSDTLAEAMCNVITNVLYDSRSKGISRWMGQFLTEHSDPC